MPGWRGALAQVPGAERRVVKGMLEIVVDQAVIEYLEKKGKKVLTLRMVKGNG